MNKVNALCVLQDFQNLIYDKKLIVNNIKLGFVVE